MSASQARTARQTAGDIRRTRGTTAAPPFVLDRYRLHRRLGSGAFGTVWLARDERLERDVAVKILPRERVMGGRFEREARAAARLAHPGIVTLYEATVDDEGAYLVSELVRGPTLDQLLEAGRLSDHDIVSIGLALCDALEHAHTEGVVHRDVKPSNVLVPERPPTPGQLAKLTDFGVARVVGGDSLTLTGDVIGTQAYMAPEQAEGLEAGPGADLYSLALVLYEALTGVNPVRMGTAAHRARRLGAHLPPLRRQRRGLPHELGQGIDMALRPRPRERGTITDLRRALERARELVGDEPGIVTSPWSRHDEPREDAWGQTGEAQALARHKRSNARDAQREARAPAPPWPARGLAALAAAATAVWLSTHVLTPTPLPPALAALLAGGLVLALPRIGWLGLTVAACGAAIIQDHAGFALLALIALAVPVVFMVRRATDWPLAAAAPLLGMIGLAGAWPAFAGRAPTPWRRAALGAAGWVWLLLATPVTGGVLYLPRLPGVPSPGAWASSPYDTLHHVLVPALRTGALAPALPWALAAVVLPWVVRGRSPTLDLVRVVIWSATLVSATSVAMVAVNGSDAIPPPPSAVLGAVACAAIALAPPWLAALRLGWRAARQSHGSGGQFP